MQTGARVGLALRRSMPLLAVGLVSEVIYLAVTLRLPWWRYGGTLHSWSRLLSEEAAIGSRWQAFGVCLAGIGVLMAAYALGWRTIRSRSAGPVERRLVWGFAILFALTLFWLVPITADLFIYLSQAHLFTDLGANPLLDAALDLRGPATTTDPLVAAYPAPYANNPSVYGPAWTLLSIPGTLGPHDVTAGLAYLKGLAVIAYLGSAWLVQQIFRQIGPVPARRPHAMAGSEAGSAPVGEQSKQDLLGLYLFAWNPLILLMAVGDGHNDMVMMAVVLLAFWLLLRGYPALAFAALAFSVWIKYVSLLFFPLFLLYVWRQLADQSWRARWLVLARSGVAVLLVSAVVLVPLGSVDWAAGMVQRLLQPVNWQAYAGNASAGPGLAPTRFLVAGLLAFSVAYAILTLRLLQHLRTSTQPGADGRQWRLREILDVAFLVSLLVFVLAAARSQPWHLIWPASLAVLARQRWAWPVIAGLSALMLASQVWVEWGAPGLQILS